ncbi:ROK family transcriptional regulator [Luteipulveratus mongoliensis]|uniref:Uncharacterized protein n=1 Tax=Luteipulveratus mongoliensis TaxID=571913 RepID=A0A0K1JIA3_9MICO|nr:ROK family transcriptional regulator [Luteipulveratus mongoliensis]AKU16452.1 hypothetical protein VV02_12210 [Luteipulveratus mongoliensis]
MQHWRWDGLSAGERQIALELLRRGPMSRAALARHLSLSAPSLTRLTKPLMDSGLLVAGPETPAGQGRPATPLQVDHGEHRVVGIKITADRVYGVCTDLRAQVLSSRSRALRSRSPERVVRAVAELVRALLDDGPLAAVGVSLGGQTVGHRSVSRAPFLDWVDVDLADLLENELEVPVTVENDVVALAESELWFGAGTQHDHFALVTVGAGVGLGLVVDGLQVTTPDSGVGTVGHLPLGVGDVTCDEGHVGCVSGLLTARAITDAITRATGRPLTLDEAFALASGDPGVRTALAASGALLGRLLGLIANVSLASHLVVAGEVAPLARVAREEVLTGSRDYRPEPLLPLDIEVREGGFVDWARGAAVVGIQRLVGGQASADT